METHTNANADANTNQELQKLNVRLDKLIQQNSTVGMFFGGILRGAGITVGATLLVLAGSTILGLLGLLPGLSDIAEVIIDAFDKARLN